MKRAVQFIGSILPLLLIGVGTTSEQKSSSILLGYTFTHTLADCDVSAGGRGPRKSAGVDAAHNVVIHYDEPTMRVQTRRVLATMRSEGADLVRTVLWFRDTHPGSRPSAADVLGLLHAQDGSLSKQDIENVASYATEVRAAGYHDLVLVLGPQAEANPKCRAVRWGACFDKSTIPLSWSVVAQVKRAVNPLVRNDFRIIFDIAPEMCPTAAPQPAGANMEMYARYMIVHYVATFSDRNFVVSCGGGSSPTLALENVRALDDLFRRLHTRPVALDIHMYFAKARDYSTALVGAERQAADLDTNLFVLETFVGNDELFDTLHTLLTYGDLPRFRALSLWPLRRSAGCAFSEKLPFAISRARRAIGLHS